MKVLILSEISVNFYRFSWHYNPENCTLLILVVTTQPEEIFVNYLKPV